MEKIGRPVRVVSVGFEDKGLEEIGAVVDAEGAAGADVIMLPECWRGWEPPEPLDGETTRAMAALAKKHRMYIVSPISRSDGDKRYNTAVLLDRRGEVAGLYDKAYPYWSEFDMNPPVAPGGDAPVFNTDFGRVGMATCFDSNFPEVWKRLADQGAELVLWNSAYSAGTTLQAHALNYNYYIVSSTREGDCIVCDITGKELLYDKNAPINVSRVTLDLDRCVFHENFNMEKRDRLLAAHPGIRQEVHLPREQWFVLAAVQPGISARETAKRFGLEELRDYRDRSRREIDKLRGFRFAEKTPQ